MHCCCRAAAPATASLSHLLMRRLDSDCFKSSLEQDKGPQWILDAHFDKPDLQFYKAESCLLCQTHLLLKEEHCRLHLLIFLFYIFFLFYYSHYYQSGWTRVKARLANTGEEGRARREGTEMKGMKPTVTKHSQNYTAPEQQNNN